MAPFFCKQFSKVITIKSFYQASGKYDDDRHRQIKRAEIHQYAGRNQGKLSFKDKADKNQKICQYFMILNQMFKKIYRLHIKELENVKKPVHD